VVFGRSHANGLIESLKCRPGRRERPPSPHSRRRTPGSLTWGSRECNLAPIPLEPGSRIGSYEIKVLPAELAQDAERLARFEREAKLLASLNHTNIAHVYGFEAATLEDGSSVHFLAMELVEGEDLAGRLKRGAIPVGETLEVARQIAEALEEAHEHGIVHRDLKPANVSSRRTAR
jgi:serine/threonine protein kinase